jgi:hypothetical protein
MIRPSCGMQRYAQVIAYFPRQVTEARANRNDNVYRLPEHMLIVTYVSGGETNPSIYLYFKLPLLLANHDSLILGYRVVCAELFARIRNRRINFEIIQEVLYPGRIKR